MKIPVEKLSHNNYCHQYAIIFSLANVTELEKRDTDYHATEFYCPQMHKTFNRCVRGLALSLGPIPSFSILYAFFCVQH